MVFADKMVLEDKSAPLLMDMLALVVDKLLLVADKLVPVEDKTVLACSANNISTRNSRRCNYCCHFWRRCCCSCNCCSRCSYS